MKNYLILGFLLVGLLLLGCTLPGAPNTGGTGTNGTGSGSGNAGTGSGGTGSSGATGGTGSGSGTGTGTGSGGQDLAGLGLAQLEGLGVPIECTVTGTESGVTTTMTMKMKGKNVKGDETVVQNGQTVSTSFLMLDNVAYVKLGTVPSSGPLANCQWMKIYTNETQANVTTGGVDTNPTNNLESPNMKYDCRPGTFSDSEFTPPANACDLTALMNQIAGGTTSGGASACDSIQDAANKATCKRACDQIPDAALKAECVSNFADQ